MIFKRLFSPSHSSNKPEVRKSAIEKLSADKPQDKSILHELAFNDSDPQVTLAALNKLNSFALWQKAAQSAHHEQVAAAGGQHVRRRVGPAGPPQESCAGSRAAALMSCSSSRLVGWRTI